MWSAVTRRPPDSGTLSHDSQSRDAQVETTRHACTMICDGVAQSGCMRFYPQACVAQKKGASCLSMIAVLIQTLVLLSNFIVEKHLRSLICVSLTAAAGRICEEAADGRRNPPAGGCGCGDGRAPLSGGLRSEQARQEGRHRQRPQVSAPDLDNILHGLYCQTTQTNCILQTGCLGISLLARLS